jgi:trichohyalin
VEYFDYSSVSPGGEIDDVQQFLEKSTKKEKQRLEKLLQQIDNQLEERGRIHQEATEELESKLDWYIERLEKHYLRSTGKGDGEREKLKQRIEEFYREMREEDRQHWRDKQELEKDRREIIRELNELDDTEMITELL